VIAESPVRSASTTRSLNRDSVVHFRLAERLHGFAALEVSEVLRTDQVAAVPQAPSPVRGLTMQRGRVLTVLDGETLLGLPNTMADSTILSLVVLAAPFSHLGIAVPGEVGLSALGDEGRLPDDPDTPEAQAVVRETLSLEENAEVRMLDPKAVVRAVERLCESGRR
jgi:chemotaxis signal transduction protein